MLTSACNFHTGIISFENHFFWGGEKSTQFFANLQAEPESAPLEMNIDDVLAGHYSNIKQQGRTRGGGESKNLRLHSSAEAEELALSLLKCLRSSIHVPKREPTDLRFSQELGSVLLKSSGSAPPLQDGMPLAALLIAAALGSPRTDHEAVQGSLICIDRISMEWPAQTVRTIMKGYSRLLMTITHASDEFKPVVDIASGLVRLIVDQVGWEEADMKMEDAAMASFLDCSDYHPKVSIALSYLTFRSKKNSDSRYTLPTIRIHSRVMYCFDNS